jgi:hypothetical protein
MSATPPGGPAPTGGARCAFCHTALEPDQEWCLSCGVARTVIRRPPDWRVAAAVMGTVVLAALVAFVVAVANLGDSPAAARRSASARPDPSSPSARTAAPAGAQIASWPSGLSGWTVKLASATTAASAEATARSLAAHGLGVGVLNSSEHPHMHPGLWVVFSHRYPLQAQAQAAAAKLVAAGHPGAAAIEVAPPGGI